MGTQGERGEYEFKQPNLSLAGENRLYTDQISIQSIETVPGVRIIVCLCLPEANVIHYLVFSLTWYL